MRRFLRIGILLLAALVMVAGLAWAVGFSGPTPESALPRRDLFVAMLTLGVLCLALFGFDLRDWY